MSPAKRKKYRELRYPTATSISYTSYPRSCDSGRFKQGGQRSPLLKENPMSTDEKTEQLFDATANEWGLFRASSYGWLDADTPDPEYPGYTAHALGNLNNALDCQPRFPGPVVRRPSEVEREIARTSDDFIGLMDLGQVQIVQAIVLGRKCENIHFPSHRYGDRLFWLANSSALVLLAATADRLQRLASSGALLDRESGRRTAVDRLVQLCDRYPDDPYAVRSLSLGQRLKAAVDERHALVHKIGSPDGMLTDSHFGALMSDVSNAGGAADWVTRSPPAKSQFDCSADEIHQMLSRLVDGYKAAIEFGNFVLFAVVSPR
jgi:hypothetical protein